MKEVLNPNTFFICICTRYKEVEHKIDEKNMALDILIPPKTHNYRMERTWKLSFETTENLPLYSVYSTYMSDCCFIRCCQHEVIRKIL